MATATTTTATELSEAIFAQVDELFDTLEGQLLVSQNRWVDNLLDLYNLVELPSLQQVIEETLSEIRHLGSLEGSWMREQLLAIVTSVEVESAFDATAALIH